jgi:hypothetical protein
VLGQVGDVLALEDDRALTRFEKTGEQVDQRRLPGTVGADQGMARTRGNIQADVAGRDEAAEALQQLAGLQRVGSFGTLRGRRRRAPARAARP